MGRNQGDIDIIQAELAFLKEKYDLAFRERDLRQLKGLSLWISKLEVRLEKTIQKSQKNSVDYIKEYKNQKKVNGTSIPLRKQKLFRG